MRTKQSPVLLLPEDELALQAAIVAAHPHVRIYDESGPWPDGEPAVREKVTETGRVAGIWPTDLFPELPREVRSDGTTWGKAAGLGPAIQWWRSRVDSDGALQTGRLAARIVPGTEDFVKSVFRILFRVTTKDLVRVHGPTGERVRMPTYRVGPHALAEARAGRIALMDIMLVLYPAGSI